jgi:hypothetical protein
MRVSEYYFYHGQQDTAPQPPPDRPGILPAVRPVRPHDRVSSNVRNHSWWVSTQLRPQVSGQPMGQSQFSQPCEVRHLLTPSRPFLTGEDSTMEGLLSPQFYGRPAWTTRASRTEMYSPRRGWNTQDLHNLRHFSQANLTSRLIAPPSASIAGSHNSRGPQRPKHVHRYVENLGAAWTPRQGARGEIARGVHADLDAFDARLAGMPGGDHVEKP